MPQIKEYEAPEGLGFRPTETGVESIAAAGRRVASNYGEAAAASQDTGSRIGRATDEAVKVAEQYVEHREIAAGSKTEAQIIEGLTKKWNETAKNADPNDPTVAAKFREEILEPTLDKFSSGFMTPGAQKWAMGRTDALRRHVNEKTSADMSSLAATAATTNVREIGNRLSNTAMTDPSSVPFLLGNVNSSIGDLIDSNPNLKGPIGAKAKIELTERMREGIVKAGAIGAIQKSDDPEKTAADWGAKYPDYINGAELKSLGQAAKQQRNADIRDQKWNAALDKQATQDRSDQREGDYLKAIYSGDLKEQAKVSTKAIVNDPSLTRQSKERMINIVNRELKPETDTRISARTSADIMRSMRDPNADPKKIEDMIFEARTKEPGTPGSITKSDFTDLQKQLVDTKTPQGAALAADRNEFFKRFAPTIDPSMGDITSMQFGHHSALGQTKMYDAEKAARRMEEDLRRAGKDPHALYDPSSPDFFGKPSNIMKYRASMQDSLNYQKEIGKETVTGVDVIDVKNIPSTWQYSASRNQYRDPSTGKTYDATGKAVK